ncbi:salt tolerance receptor-like cytoplasmic kinase 1 [Tasmannia lanceolata]|uniref:salt tolerance receptor-like cytoplasmic kinase 1 n=1 Tax=Tasmannia lanceolata TaxID=3420 RepID=UPI004064855B
MAFSSISHKISKMLCSRSACLSVCGLYPSILFLIFISFQPNFSVASFNIPTSSPPLKRDKTISTSQRILIALSISVLFFTLVLLMAYFKCLRFKIRRKSKQDEGGERGLVKTHVVDRPDSQSHSTDLSKDLVRRFSWEEIESLTMNFSSAIGEGGFSTVYLACFADSTLGALKIHTNSERLNRVFKQELEVLMHIRHENIVKLLGYCDEREEGVLVFEYIANGSLHDKLFNIQEGMGPLLTWNRRMLIAFQLARAIEYLHDNCSLPIVHSDIKTSNILLDEQLNCKLCDFGFAKMGFSSTILPSSMHPLMGSPGYMDPHYLRTGMASKKNDVYSFGVLVLELITGIEAFCSEKQQLLTYVASPILKDTTKVIEMVDSKLGEEFDKEEAITMAYIASLCLCPQPSLRPSMAEILRIMKEKISSVSFADAGESKDTGK